MYAIHLKHCVHRMSQNADLSGHGDLEPLELLESDNESLRSYEVYTM